MKPRYVIIDEYKRDKFEKEWQLPFGYSHCFVSIDPQEAISQLHSFVEGGMIDPSTCIVEKISEEGRELYYRI